LNARSSWLEELWRVVVLLVAAIIVGFVIDYPLALAALALLAYTLRNLYNLKRLADWLGDPRAESIPIHFGLWGDIFARVARVSSRQAQREKRLNRMVQEYSASTAALPDATVALDSSGRILWFNEAASALLGLVAAKDIGQPLQHLFRNPEIPAFIANRDFGRSIQTKAPVDPNLRLELRLAPYGEGQMLLLAQDITERIHQERVRKDFVANVSHELRTPLTVVSGFIENLQNDDTLPADRVARPLELMAQQAARMGQIVEDLLVLARLESQPIENHAKEVSMTPLLQQVADECAGLRDDAPDISVQLRSRRLILGDEKQLRSAISNLVSNAVHHTPHDGQVRICWEDDGGDSTLAVIDDGEGIASEHIPRLTERFYRADTGRSRQRGGTGLGLAIVKHILKRHHADLEIYSEPGKGSRFVCRFPGESLQG
jgi:two-component system phosphate regulon sensor histidine kinase PhoR